MPFRCSVVNCKGNYKTGPKVSVFKFPEDSEIRRKWIKAVSRKDFVVTSSSRVCERHFPKDAIIREIDVMDSSSGVIQKVALSFPKLRDGVAPSIFEGCPSYMSKPTVSRPSPAEKMAMADKQNISIAIQQSLKEFEDYEKKRTYSSIPELKEVLKTVDIDSSWIVRYIKDEVHFYQLHFSPAPVLLKSVLIDKDLNIVAFFKSCKISKFGKLEFPCKKNNINDLLNILTEFSIKENSSECDVENLVDIIIELFNNLKQNISDDKKTVIDFLIEQVSLLLMKKNRLHYSSELLIFCSLLFSISPHAYKFLRDSNQLIFPHPSTIERLCSSFKLNPQLEQLEDKFLLYAKTRFELLKPEEIKVSLMIDEIHIKQYFDFKGGNVVGKSINNDKAASTAYVFMLQGICSNFHDVVHILPVQNIESQYLHMYIKKIILGLEKIGYFVVCVTTDNNALNGKAMSYFATPPQLSIVYSHPSDPSRPLFYIFDPVHILKCIRNNWLNQKNYGQCMYYIDFNDFSVTKTASFKTIKNVHSLEDGQIVKYVYGLTLKALSPSSMERQNVKLCLQIFNDHVVEGLKVLSNHTNESFCSETAEYISIIIKWWKIMNVKNKFKGTHKRDVYCEPLSANESDQKVIYLKNFLVWLDTWKSLNYSTGFLTKETFTALSHTTHAVLQLRLYCCNELKMSYLLTGKIQTDVIENRFGKFRQLSGSQYNISLRQVFENESKLRLQTLAPLISSRYGNLKVSFANLKEFEQLKKIDTSYFKEIIVSEEDFVSLVTILPLLTYIAGYCCYSIIKSKKCSNCKKNLTLDNIDDAFDIVDHEENRYILNFDKGGLCYPKPEVLDVIMHSYIIIKKLISEKYEKKFLEFSDQRLVSISLTLESIKEKEIYHIPHQCKDHDIKLIVEGIVRHAANTFLNNYCKQQNDNLLKEKQLLKQKTAENKKRKLQTLQ